VGPQPGLDAVHEAHEGRAVLRAHVASPKLVLGGKAAVLRGGEQAREVDAGQEQQQVVLRAAADALEAHGTHGLVPGG